MTRRTPLSVLSALLVIAPLLFAADPSAAAEPGQWGMAAAIDNDNTGNATNPQVALDAAGNGLAVWQQHDGSRNNIWANRYVVGMGWGSAALLETDNAGTAVDPQVAVDGSGNGFAVWAQNDGSRSNIWARRFAAETGWGAAVLIETNNSGSAMVPQVAADAGGNAVAVWSQNNGTTFDVWANRYTVGTGWSTAVLIESDGTGGAFSPQLAVSPAGNAVAVWYQFNGSLYNVWANRYSAANAMWGAAALLEFNDAGDAAFPQVAVDASGNALAVWHQSDGTRYSAWASRLVATGGWGAAQLLETTDTGAAAYAQVAFGPNGDAVAVWYLNEGGRNVVWANHYSQGTGWGPAERIQAIAAQDSSAQQVAVDGNGNAVAVWRQNDFARHNIWVNRYTAGIGWGAARLIEAEDAGSGAGPQVAVDGEGNAVAVWSHYVGAVSDVLANRIVEDYPPAIALSAYRGGYYTNVSSVLVVGTTEPGATVSVNGVAVSVAPNGTFSARVAVAPGATVINATARDRAGNEASAYANCTFDDPLPAVEQALAAALANLAAAQADLATIQGALAATESELADAIGRADAADTRLQALEESGAATDTELEAARGNLTAAQGRVADLSAAVNATLAGLLAANARVSATEAALDAARADLSAASQRMAELEADLAAVEGALAASEASQEASIHSAADNAAAAVALAALGVVLGAALLAMAGRRKAGSAEQAPRGEAKNP